VVKGEKRAQLVATAARLLAEKGPTGTSFGDVLRTAGGARGSTYYHFPLGKREMYDAALDLASERAYAAIEDARGQSADLIVETFFGMWRTLLTRTDLRLGCAVLAVAVAGDDEQNVDHAGEIFTTWRGHLESLFIDSGLERPEAKTLAALAIASAEGAVAIARAEKSIESFELVATRVTELARAS
jgi:TetR/AcrR family transcriptional repressor of lmrAB and yxaGH operons